MSAPKVSKANVEQTIDLGELFGVSFKGKPALREAIGQAIIDKMVKRTEAGDGVRFGKSGAGSEVSLHSPYSKAYSKSLSFKAFGKSRGDVNMTLTGDMLADINIKRQSGDSVTVGFQDSTETKKAFNHITGDTVPERPFFGCSKGELKAIANEFKTEVKQAIKVKADEGTRGFNLFVQGLLGNIEAERVKANKAKK